MEEEKSNDAKDDAKDDAKNDAKNIHVVAKDAEKNLLSAAAAANITELPEKRKDAVKNAQDVMAYIKGKIVK